MSSLARRWYLLCLLVATAAALSTPAGASAVVGRFNLRGTHGYKLAIFDFGFRATLQATRVKDQTASRGTWIDYTAPMKPSANRVDVGFGELGHVAMRFHPSGLTTHSKPRQGCRGPNHYTYRHGVFVGSFEFRGEGGFTSAHVHRVKGTTVTPAGSLHCSASGQRPPTGTHPGGDAKRPKRTSLEAAWRSGLAARFFFATTDGHASVSFEATTTETQGALAIFREAVVQAPPASFASDSALSFASVSPPPPFSGTGTIGRAPSGVKGWVGNLAVSFPGDPDVPLTGPQFKTWLSRSL